MQFGPVQIPEEHVVYKSELSYVFVSLRPFLPYHFLVSPKRCSDRLSRLTEEESRDLFETIRKVTKALECLSDGWTVTLQDGEAAGQTVKHLHFHVIPRKHGDLKQNNDVYRGVEMDAKVSNRSPESMRDDASFLRELLRQNGVY